MTKTDMNNKESRMNRQQTCGKNRRGPNAQRGGNARINRPMGREGEQQMVQVTIIVNEGGTRRGRHGRGPRPGRMGQSEWGHAERGHGRRHHGQGRPWRDERGEGQRGEHGRGPGRGEPSRHHGRRADGGRVVGRVIEMPDGSTRICLLYTSRCV